MSVLLLLIGIIWVLLGLATSVPPLAVAGGAYVLGAWVAHLTRGMARGSFLRATAATVFVTFGSLVAVAVAYLLWTAQPPAPDAFYDPPSTLPSSPGVLLRYEPFTRAVPPGGRAWRILYTTTRDNDAAAVASAVVLTSANVPPGPRPVVSWTHGTTGVVPGCAPSVLPSPYPFDPTVPALGQLIAQGWVLVGTDYTGLGTRGPHPYLIGEGEARSALDAVRAARQLREIELEKRTIAWGGHSQGGHAALWTGILAPRYAPDVNLVGVAALAPATDIGALVEAAQATPVGRVMSAYVVTAYSAAYPDVRFDEYIGPRERGDAMANRCLAGSGAILSILVSAALGKTMFAIPPTQGTLGKRFQENMPLGHIAAPLLIAQGSADALVLPAVQEQFVQRRCREGQHIEYRTYGGRDHVSLMASDSALIDDLVTWTQGRLTGTPVAGGCSTVSR
jgi:hypothetical protein